MTFEVLYWLQYTYIALFEMLERSILLFCCPVLRWRSSSNGYQIVDLMQVWYNFSRRLWWGLYDLQAKDKLYR